MMGTLRNSFALLLLCCLAVQAGTAWPDCRDPGAGGQDQEGISGLLSGILYSILDLRFGEADSLLEHALGQFPADPGMLYLQNYLDFLDALIAGDRPGFGEYIEASGERIEALLGEAQTDPEADACLSSVHLQSSLLCAYHGESFRAAKHYYHAYRHLRRSEEKDPGNPLNYRNRGLITLVSASAPGEYRWLLNLIGLREGMGEGFGSLQEYYRASDGAGRLEACLLLRFAGHTLDPGQQDLYDFCSLAGTGEAEQGEGEFTTERPGQRGPGQCSDADNTGSGPVHGRTLLRYAGALADLGSGNSRGVLANIGDYRQEQGERALPYLDLLRGEALLDRLDPAAGVPLRRFIRENTGIHYRHYAWHRLSWHHALNGDWKLYREAVQEVAGCGEPFLDADRQSLREALDTLPLNIDLLKARLLFDGGEYRKAMEELGQPKKTMGGSDVTGIPLLNRRDSLEYRYRLGRIHERLGETAEAMASYEQVIASGSGEEWYFAPNAALHLGRIHELAGNAGQAMEHYRQCLKINRSAYKKSIDYKARQGIRRIENRMKNP